MLRRRWVAVLGLVTVIGLAYVVLYTPALGVRSVEVRGADTVSVQRIREVAEVPEQRAMLRVSTGEIAERVDTLPEVAATTVSRSWPSTVTITVSERTPVGFSDTGGVLYLMDREGVGYKEISEPPEDLPELEIPQGAGDTVARSVSRVLSEIPDGLQERIRVVRAETEVGIEFLLTDDTVVHWGDAQQTDRKSAVLDVLLTRDGETYDVASPDLPTVS